MGYKKECLSTWDFKSTFYKRIVLCQAPKLTKGHKLLGIATILGFLFVITHIITVIITCAVAGFGWGTNAWIFDITGFVTGLCFALLCWKASNRNSIEIRDDVFWIFVWSAITVCARILDTLMLFGIVKISSIYITPTGIILYSNIVSEVIIALPYALFALVGSTLLLCFSKEEIFDEDNLEVTLVDS